MAAIGNPVAGLVPDPEPEREESMLDLWREQEAMEREPMVAMERETMAPMEREGLISYAAFSIACEERYAAFAAFEEGYAACEERYAAFAAFEEGYAASVALAATEREAKAAMEREAKAAMERARAAMQRARAAMKGEARAAMKREAMTAIAAIAAMKRKESMLDLCLEQEAMAASVNTMAKLKRELYQRDLFVFPKIYKERIRSRYLLSLSILEPETEPEPEPEPETGILDLPEVCILYILSFTMPCDIGRLSVVSKPFKSVVASSDNLWKNSLLKICHQIVSRADPPVPASMAELYARLVDPILIDGGTKMAWMEGSPAKLGYMLSARALNIMFSDDEQYWRFVPGDGYDSRFKVLADLSVVWWLEVRGQIDCRLLSPNTNYRVVFALKFTENPFGWEVPIRFSVTTPEGEQMELKKRLNERRGENQGINGGWMEVAAGEFTTRPERDDGDDSHIEFYMKEVSGMIPKGGLLLDGVKIEPIYK